MQTHSFSRTPLNIRININKGNQQKLTLSENTREIFEISVYEYEYLVVRPSFHRFSPVNVSFFLSLFFDLVVTRAPPNDYPKKCINLKVITHLCITSRVFCAAVAAATAASIKSLYSSLRHFCRIYLSRWSFCASHFFFHRIRTTAASSRLERKTETQCK